MGNLNVGDVVVLKSGGAKMTVLSVNENKIAAIWMNNNNDLKSEFFLAETLKRVKRDSTGVTYES